MAEDIKELKELEREATRNDAKPDGEDCGGSFGWVPGLVLVGIGALLLLNNFTGFRLHNWWALFILIPAFGSLGNFVRSYNSGGRLSHEARGSLIGSMILFFIAAVFLFGWSWAVVWPFFLIIGGVGALLSALLD